jgi:hypothetical protein
MMISIVPVGARFRFYTSKPQPADEHKDD